MVKRHLMRLNAPKTWKIQRRGIQFITRNNPGGMSARLTVPISNILKYELKLANSIKEVKHLIKTDNVFVNGNKITDYKYPVCFTDVVSFPKIKTNYRLIIDSNETLQLIHIDDAEAKLKLIKIAGKNYVKGKIQLNLMDGRNIFFEKHHYKVGDSLLLSMHDQVVKEHLAFEKGALVLLYAGKHVGKIGILQEIIKDDVIIKTGTETYETKKNYAMVVGKDKPVLKMTK